MAVLAVVGWISIGIVIAVGWGVAVVALAALVVGSTPNDPAEWFVAARVFFILACIAQLLTLRRWWETDRARNWFSAVGG